MKPLQQGDSQWVQITHWKQNTPFASLPEFYLYIMHLLPLAYINLINLNNNEYICHGVVVTTIEGQHHSVEIVEQRRVLKLI